MADNYWPEGWTLRDKMLARWYYFVDRGGLRAWVRVLVIAALVVMYFLPELVRVVRFLLH